MEQQLQEIRDAQKQSWDKFSQGWKKWDVLTMDFLKPMGDEIIRLLSPSGNNVVLDIASGTGEPGITIATMLKGGKVVSTDLSNDMLRIAQEKAQNRKINNFEIKACDVSELPFESNTFDAISCRFGFMFFPDMSLAVKEMARVLKPGGKIATSVWGAPEKNFWVTAIMGTINKNMELPAPPAGAPGMFRCAKPGLIAGLFKEAGLKNVTENEIFGKLKTLTAENYWNMMTEVGAPIVAALSKADENLKSKIKSDVLNLVSSKYAENKVEIDSFAIVISGTK